MATAAAGITISGLVSSSEIISISVSESGGAKAIGYSSGYNPDAGTATIVSLDSGGTVGASGTFTALGYSGFGIVESVEESAAVGDVIRYTTTVQLIAR